jgi:hypothetical protein
MVVQLSKMSGLRGGSHPESAVQKCFFLGPLIMMVMRSGQQVHASNISQGAAKSVKLWLSCISARPAIMIEAEPMVHSIGPAQGRTNPNTFVNLAILSACSIEFRRLVGAVPTLLTES